MEGEGRKEELQFIGYLLCQALSWVSHLDYFTQSSLSPHNPLVEWALSLSPLAEWLKVGIITRSDSKALALLTYTYTQGCLSASVVSNNKEFKTFVELGHTVNQSHQSLVRDLNFTNETKGLVGAHIWVIEKPGQPSAPCNTGDFLDEFVELPRMQHSQWIPPTKFDIYNGPGKASP